MYQEASVYISDSLTWQKLSHGGCDAEATACAMYNDSYPVTGWSELWIRAIPRDSSYVAYRTSMYAAGYAEGALTHHWIYQHFRNTWQAIYGDDKGTPPKVNTFLRENLAWMRANVKRYAEPDVVEHSAADVQYWQTIGGLLAQFDGLVAGYHDFSGPTTRLTDLDLFLLSSNADVSDIIPVVNETFAAMKRIYRRRHMPYHLAAKGLKCSALIRLAADKSDVLWGHTTWDMYTSMIRLYKHYDFPVPALRASDPPKRRQMAFSASPGYLASGDDWYLMDNQMAVMETTIGLFNDKLEKLITPHSIQSWLRVNAANLLATDGHHWTNLFAKYNSGTYNNHWMVLTLDRFRRGHGFLPGGLMILEQLPGAVESMDVSKVLNTQGYWASYNLPYLTTIWKLGGFRAEYIDSNFNPSWLYHNCSRARIFQRDAPKVETLAQLKRLIRYNNFRVDPLSQGMASHAIAARYDLLDGDDATLEGATDAKVTSLKRALNMECETTLGPTSDQNPPFDWRKAPASETALHLGHPDVFNFSFVPMRPRAFPTKAHPPNQPA
eukprot:GGOE01004364.1.p1 GENE.GGOE01004364.1~~GGOE01004364.1.p1  ORF type:complete len:600 (+),score=169.97 GGOE01004364.1:147-1802(+)